jgi:hypothetical protein
MNIVIEESLYRDDTDAHVVRELIKGQAKQFLDEAAEHLAFAFQLVCFIDIVFLVPTGPTGASRGFVAAATDKAQKAYSKLIEQLIKSRLDVAGHPTFRAGLPGLKMADGSRRHLTPKEIPLVRDAEQAPYLEDDLAPHLDELTDLKSDEERSSRVIAATFSVGPWDFTRRDAEDEYGGEDRSIDDNFRGYCSFLLEVKDHILDAGGRPLRHVIAAPITFTVHSAENKSQTVYGGSFFVGTSVRLGDGELKKITKLVAEMVGGRYLLRTGERKQQTSFAHQNSPVIDSIVKSVEQLPIGVRDGMGDDLIAKLHVLRADINSYRSRATRVDAGPFPLNWDKSENPLSLYRDIGIQLGLARCENAPPGEGAVTKYGYAALRPENQLGELGFNQYRLLFSDLPEVPARVQDLLKHSSLAVLILNAMKQAFYHTVRARKLNGDESAQIKINLKEEGASIDLQISITNPPINSDGQLKESKDVEELRDSARRLSNMPEGATYEVEGPVYVPKHHSWVTSIRARMVEKAPP